MPLEPATGLRVTVLSLVYAWMTAPRPLPSLRERLPLIAMNDAEYSSSSALNTLSLSDPEGQASSVSRDFEIRPVLVVFISVSYVEAQARLCDRLQS